MFLNEKFENTVQIYVWFYIVSIFKVLYVFTNG